MVKRIRKFYGGKYRLISHTSNKLKALRDKSKLMKQGYSVRLVRKPREVVGMVYYLYAKKK